MADLDRRITLTVYAGLPEGGGLGPVAFQGPVWARYRAGGQTFEPGDFPFRTYDVADRVFRVRWRRDLVTSSVQLLTVTDENGQEYYVDRVELPNDRRRRFLDMHCTRVV